MNDLLLDGGILDAANDGNWAVVGAVGSVVLLAVILGLTSWLKGRKAIAVLVWLLIGAGVTLLIIPVDTVKELVDASTTALAWSTIGLATGAILIGAISSYRLARPPSWWAQRRYDNDRYAAAIERHQWTRPQAR